MQYYRKVNHTLCRKLSKLWFNEYFIFSYLW